MNINDFLFFSPELYMVYSIILLLCFSLYVYQTKFYYIEIYSVISLYLNFGVTVILLYFYVQSSITNKYFFFNTLTQTSNLIQIKSLIIILSIFILYLSIDFIQKTKISFFEYVVLYHIATTGALFTISSNDLLILYISLEVIALSLYVLCAITKTLENTTGSLKYFIVGSFSSAVFVYGSSLIFLLTGHHNFDKINAFLIFFDNINSLEIKTFIVLGQFLILSSLLFKLAMAPFHVWVADIYENISTSTALYISIIPKIVVFTVLSKMVLNVLSNLFYYTYIIISIACIFSLFLGVIHTLKQKNIKRFLAYSSISHFGLISLGLIQKNPISGLNASMLYLNTYVIMAFFFWSLLLISSYVKIINTKKVNFNLTTITELKYINSINPGLAFALCVNLLSMGGLPPFSGFIAKASIFFTLVESFVLEKSSIGIAIILLAIFASLTSVYYYLKITKNLFFTSKTKNKTNVLFIFKTNSFINFVLGLITMFNLCGLFILF